MKKGEAFERFLSDVLVGGGYCSYRRPKVRYHSQDMFMGDLLWLCDGDIVVVQCKKGNDIIQAKSRARVAVRKGGVLVKRYLGVACGRGFKDMVVFHLGGEAFEYAERLADLLRCKGATVSVEFVDIE